MISGLYRVVAFVLLALLPLQATAVLTICPYSKSAAVQQSSAAPVADVQDCHQGRAGNSDASRDDGGNQTCCATAAGCALCGLAANTLPLQRVANPVGAAQYCLSSQFTSFVPEGLQRPPGLLAS